MPDAPHDIFSCKTLRPQFRELASVKLRGHIVPGCFISSKELRSFPVACQDNGEEKILIRVEPLLVKICLVF